MADENTPPRILYEILNKLMASVRNAVARTVSDEVSSVAVAVESPDSIVSDVSPEEA